VIAAPGGTGIAGELEKGSPGLREKGFHGPPKSGGFWQSIPGVLTALAAVITAVVGAMSCASGTVHPGTRRL